MSKRGLIRAAGIAAAIAISFAGVSQADAQARRIATLAPEGSSWLKILNKGAKAVEEATNGRVTTIYYSGGSQGDERDVVRKMRQGGIDGAALTSVGLSMIYKGIRVLELPRLFTSVAQMDCVRKKMWKYFRMQFDKRGYILGEAGDVGWVYFLSKKPIASMADLRKLKVWMWTDDRLVRAMFKKMKMSGVPLGVPDVRQALAGNRIQAAYGSPLVAVALQWAGKVRYMTSMPMSYAMGATIIRKDVWLKSSEADRKVQRTVAKNLSRVMRSTIRGDNRSSRATMLRKGVKVLETPPAMVAEFDAAAHEVWKDLEGKLYSKWELKTVLSLREKYKNAKSLKDCR